MLDDGTKKAEARPPHPKTLIRLLTVKKIAKENDSYFLTI